TGGDRGGVRSTRRNRDGDIGAVAGQGDGLRVAGSVVADRNCTRASTGGGRLEIDGDGAGIGRSGSASASVGDFAEVAGDGDAVEGDGRIAGAGDVDALVGAGGAEQLAAKGELRGGQADGGAGR